MIIQTHLNNVIGLQANARNLLLSSKSIDGTTKMWHNQGIKKYIHLLHSCHLSSFGEFFTAQLQISSNIYRSYTFQGGNSTLRKF